MHTTTRRFKTVLFIFASVLFACTVRTALAQSVPMLLQAEAMSTAGSTAPMWKGADIAAMGGQFIEAPGGATSTTTPVRGASAQVNVPAAGPYFLWARIAGPTSTSDALYVGIDSSFARVFPTTAPSGSYEWVRVPISDGLTTFDFNLAAGSHAIQVGYGEVGAKLDAVYLTADATDVPTFAPPAMRLLIEGEWMNLQAPMTVGSDAAANGGQYISPTSGTDSTTPVREANFALQVPAGTYYLWARIAGLTPASDALYVGIGSSWARVSPQTVPSGTYEWVKVPTTNGGNTFGFALTAGVKTIQVGHGEIGARLDAVYLTADANEVPSVAPMRRVIEAESFNLQSTPPTMIVRTDAAAIGGQYLTTTNTANSTSPVREAWTTVNAPATGTYYLWARLMGPDINSDALYVGFDNTFIRVFQQHGIGAYEWVRVEATPGSGFQLSAGPHAIQVGSGEVGARLDAVYVTNDANDTPSGTSAPPPLGPCAIPSGGYPGFGRTATGGAAFAGTPTPVTNLNDAGPGSLRDALSQGGRCIIFNVGGPINLNSQLNVHSDVTIDGFTAPSPGITLINNAPGGANENSAPAALSIHGGDPANGSTTSNVIVRGIRIRKSPGDGISVFNASQVVIDHVSISGYQDGAIDITQHSKDVTVQWSILSGDNTIPGDPNHHFPTLISYKAHRVSVHHNLFIGGNYRHPNCSLGDTNTVTGFDPNIVITCDVRNNVVWDFAGHGTQVFGYGKANVIGNYYYSKGRAASDGTVGTVDNVIKLTINDSHNVAKPGQGYLQGNHARNPGWNLEARQGNGPELPADAPATTDALTAARDVKGLAGARNPNLDSTDQAYIDEIDSTGL
jgi:hypothetical protein